MKKSEMPEEPCIPAFQLFESSWHHLSDMQTNEAADDSSPQTLSCLNEAPDIMNRDELFLLFPVLNPKPSNKKWVLSTSESWDNLLRGCNN